MDRILTSFKQLATILRLREETGLSKPIKTHPYKIWSRQSPQKELREVEKPKLIDEIAELQEASKSATLSEIVICSDPSNPLSKYTRFKSFLRMKHVYINYTRLT